MQNNPFDGSTFQNLDDETQMVFMRAHTQYQVMMMSLQALAEAKEENGMELHFDNDQLLAFNEEFAKFLAYRKALMKTSWGHTLKTKVNALRKTAAFQDLKKQWKKECKTAQGQQLKTKFEHFMEMSVQVFILSDKPQGFTNLALVKTFVEMIDMFDETLDGHTGQVIDWIFNEE